MTAVLAERRANAPQRTKAIIIYPMNALANSQLEELDKFMSNVEGEKPITSRAIQDRRTLRNVAELLRTHPTSCSPIHDAGAPDDASGGG